MHKRIPLHNLVAPGALVLPLLLLFFPFFLLFSLLLDFCEFPHKLLGVFLVVIFAVGLFGWTRHSIIRILREWVVFYCLKPRLALFLLLLCGWLVRSALSLGQRLRLFHLKFVAVLLTRQPLVGRRLRGLSNLQLHLARCIAVVDLCRLNDKIAAGICHAAGDCGIPCWSVSSRHCNSERLGTMRVDANTHMRAATQLPDV